MWITDLYILWLLKSSCSEPERRDHLTYSACRGFMDNRPTRASLGVRLGAPDCFAINGKQSCALARLPRRVLRTSPRFSSTDTISSPSPVLSLLITFLWSVNHLASSFSMSSMSHLYFLFHLLGTTMPSLSFHTVHRIHKVFGSCLAPFDRHNRVAFHALEIDGFDPRYLFHGGFDFL